MTELAWIKWKDASYEHGDVTKDELQPGTELQTAGILVGENDEYVTLALDHYGGNDKFQPLYRHVVHIPKVNILKQRRFEVRRT